MAIMMIMSWEGVTLEQYDALKAAVNWEENPAEGGHVHVTAHDGSGLRVTDVWDSHDAFLAFVNNRLVPATMEQGVTTQPLVEIYPLHDLFIAEGG